MTENLTGVPAPGRRAELERHAAAVFAAGALRITWLTRLGLVLFVLAPALCILALVGDFYRL